MSIKSILIATYLSLSKWPKWRLIQALERLRTRYAELEARANKLKEENAKLRQQLEQQKIQATNKQVNKPSSKQAEWEKGSSKDKGKKKSKRRNRKSRKGAGNRPKNLVPNNEETATVDTCDFCGKDLSAQAPLESTNERIIEDIVAPPEETVVTLVTQQKKYCADCKKVTTAKSDLALTGADMGLNATVLVCYLWVALCLPYTKIKEYLQSFFQIKGIDIRAQPPCHQSGRDYEGCAFRDFKRH